jgi:UDP-N-acetylglucosamine 2-epimerase (non-hydrolysing)
MKIVSIVGARPNFMKIAPFIRAISEHNKNNTNKIHHTLVHTGQHYDIRMSQKFFDELNIPSADIHLGIGSGTHAEQVGKTMIEFEKVLSNIKPDVVVVVGDVNAILAGSVTAKKEQITLAHIEAGLRSFDMSMPEEINRIVADRLSDLLFTPDKIANQHLLNEGVKAEKIHFVGNIMIDTLEHERSTAEKLDIKDIIEKNIIENSGQKNQEIEHRKYLLMTLHRPSNVDNKEILENIFHFIDKDISAESPVLFPIHPRTQKNMATFGLWDKMIQNPNIIFMHPLGYHEMLRLNMSAKAVMTDSGGLQEECTVLGTPCYTMRLNTERPVTLKEYGGLSILVGNHLDKIKKEFSSITPDSFKPVFPELWDGKAADRIVNILSKLKF